MKLKFIIPVLVMALILFGIGGAFAVKKLFLSSGSSASPTPTPIEESVEQLTPDKYPKISLTFTSDGHYATIKITDIHADKIEYDLQYQATVKNKKLGQNERIGAGVSGSADLAGASEYTNKQLLGSESSGKFTYHEDISEGEFNLALRSSDGTSIFKGSYAFDLTPGKTVELTLSE